MTDAHYHRDGYATFLSLGDREFCFYGFHPWQAFDLGEAALLPLREKLAADPHAGVGEIGLDRLKSREISAAQRSVFAAQLELAAEFRRPVVLHGAKCWGEVVAACRPYAGRIPAFLFHGFSRSGGLLPEIVALNGFVGVGAALLNDHAVNYRALVKEIPLERLVVETDADYGRAEAQTSLGRARSPSAPPSEILYKLVMSQSWGQGKTTFGEAALLPLPTSGFHWLKRQECRFPEFTPSLRRSGQCHPQLCEITYKLAELRGMEPDALEAVVDANAGRFVEALA